VLQGVKIKLVGLVAGGALAVVAAIYGLWFLHESYSFKSRTNEVGDALFIEQAEALRAIRGASTDRYQERLVLTLRDQLARLGEMRKAGGTLPPQVRSELRFICQQAPDVVALAREGSGGVCSGI
jgi:plasmid stabilization system protein ParE